MLGLRTEMEGLQPFLDPWVKKQNLLPLIKEKGEFVALQRKTGKQGEQRKPGNRGTGEQGKQGNKGRRNCDFVYKLLMQNFSTEEIYQLSNTCSEHAI